MAAWNTQPPQGQLAFRHLEGSAADLASRGLLAVFPVSGWWKTRPRLERYDQRADYSLLVSIHVPEADVELYTAIENQIEISVEV